MRKIVLDTETTGLDPFSGDKLIEIGAVELDSNHQIASRYHTYINPMYQVSPGAYKVHGISNDMLKNKPLFAEIAQDFLEYIQGAKLIIHNAQFDLKFINYELSLVNLPSLDQANVIDTLAIARSMFPGAKVNLDALCKRFKIDISSRNLHSASLDAELLAYVYVELTGGKQISFTFNNTQSSSFTQNYAEEQKKYTNDKIILPSEHELIAHDKFMQTIINK
ncbi:MAG: DNA polymerase III subunit epsilon [Rickettsiaceae bacterium]|nr:DNA polymerase III subunit epsilon [Rickettsiaceae bacterium]